MNREKAGARTWSAATSRRPIMPHKEGHAERRRQRREKVLTVENVTMGNHGQEHVVLGLCRRGRRHRGPDRLRPDRDRQDHLRRLEAEPDQRRHDQAARQADPLPGAEGGDQRRHRLHHRRPQAEWLLRDHGGRRQRLYRQARHQGGLALPALRSDAQQARQLIGSSG